MMTENMRIAMRALLANKLRSALTMLGITIGVGAVITLLSVGDGVSRYVTAQFEGLGTNLVFVFPGTFSLSQGPTGLRSGANALTDADWRALAAPGRVPSAVLVVPLLRRSVQAGAGNYNTEVSVRASTPDYLAARSFQLAAGR
nr:ABC transporter permease [Chloroflexota bacterium]